MSGGTINNCPTINCSGTFNYTGGSFPNTTSIDCALSTQTGYGGVINVTNMNSSVNLRCRGAINIKNSNLSGIFTLNSGYGAELSRLSISDNSTISSDISTATTNFRNFRIANSTFTHPNPLVFGTPSLYAKVDLGGVATVISQTFVDQRWTVQTLNTSKNITIYHDYDIYESILINYPKDYQTFPPYELTGYTVPYTPENMGTYTGIIKLIPVTDTYPAADIIIGGGTYAPTITIPATKVGNNYTIAYNDIPKDYGFRVTYENNYVAHFYKPTFYISGLPGGIDVLSTQI
jgi:hypothetical protein